MKYSPSVSDDVWRTLLIIILCVYVGMTAWANTDLAEGRFVLFMDERITFDGVKKILHPSEWSYFWWYITDGGDQRYGRSLWNSIALFSFIPEWVWGETGQIIAGRMLQVCILIFAFVVLAFRFVASWPLRIALLTTLLVMPYADYYMTMPKPEPLQLLLLAGFLYCHDKYKFNFGWHWIFLGLAFGTKISTLPLILVVTVASALAQKNDAKNQDATASVNKALISFMVGLGVAVPILFTQTILSVLGIYLLMLINKRWRLSNFYKTLLYCLGASLIIYIWLKDAKTEVWINSTFLNTKHGADQDSINALSWLKYFVDTWIIAPKWIGCLLVALSTCIVCIRMFSRHQADKWMRRISKDIGLQLLFCGIALNCAIFFGAHRLWGFYLFPGSVLMLVGLFSLLDTTLANSSIKNIDNILRIDKYLAHGTVAVIVIMACVYWAPSTMRTFDSQASRTKNEGYRNQYASYISIVDFLNTKAKADSRRLVVAFDPGMFPTTDNELYQIIEFWGPYTEWENNPDVIVFRSIHTENSSSPPKDSPEYNPYLVERAGYSKYVISKQDKCTQIKCFQRELILPNGGEILSLRK